MTKHEWSERTAVEWRSPNEELILVLVLMLVIDSEVRQTVSRRSRRAEDYQQSQRIRRSK